MAKDSTKGYQVSRAEVSDDEAHAAITAVLDSLPGDDIGHKLGALATAAGVLIEQSACMMAMEGGHGDDAARIANELFGEFVACAMKAREMVWEDEEVDLEPVKPENIG